MVDSWKLIQKGYQVNLEHARRTQFAIANGYRSLLGGIEFSETCAVNSILAGVFDRATAPVTEIVLTQNPLDIRLFVTDSHKAERVTFQRCPSFEFERVLDMKHGVFEYVGHFVTVAGKKILLHSKRWVSKVNPHRWGVQYTITPLNWSGLIILDKGINGAISNSEEEPYHRCVHLENFCNRDLHPAIAMNSATKDQGIHILEMIQSREGEKKSTDSKRIRREYRDFGREVREIETFEGSEGVPLSIFLHGVTFHSLEVAENDLWITAEEEMKQFLQDGWEEELVKHEKAWEGLWEIADVEIDGDDSILQALRWNIFQLTSCAPNENTRVSIGARGLHGQGYKGHVFWDTEIFMFPFFLFTQPKAAENLLMYRYRTLQGARKKAKSGGYLGAQYAWESADTGEETTPQWGVNYKGQPVRIWTGDEEIHITSDVTLAMMRYHQATENHAFMELYGVEMLFNTAIFWESRVEWNKSHQRYEIRKVIGPDEFHEHIDNNVFTNFLAQWNLRYAVSMAKWLRHQNPHRYDKLFSDLQLTQETLNRWEWIADRIYIPMNTDTGIIEQFEGYFQKEFFPISEWDEGGLPLWPVGVDPTQLNDTQLIKQPDVLMLFYLLPSLFSREIVQNNYRYYEARTMHKSSLSTSIHSALGLYIGSTEHAYPYFIKTILTDILDLQGNTADGLHAASAGGAWQAAVFGFGGLRIDRDGIPDLRPWLPKSWNSFSYHFLWKGTKVDVTIKENRVFLRSTSDLQIKVFGKEYTVSAKQPVETVLV